MRPNNDAINRALWQAWRGQPVQPDPAQTAPAAITYGSIDGGAGTNQRQHPLSEGELFNRAFRAAYLRRKAW